MTPRHRRAPGPPEAGTRALLDHFADGNPDEVIKLDDVLAGLEERAFGMLLFLSIPTAFIPGIAGVISGPLIVLVGLQLLFGRNEPWLPDAIGRHGPHRRAMRTFRDRLGPWLTRLERIAKPRNAVLLDHRLAKAYTGVVLVLLGLLLSLPIPFTNLLFAVLVLLFALALLERDGRLLLASWSLGTVAIAAFAVLSGSLAGIVGDWMDPFF